MTQAREEILNFARCVYARGDVVELRSIQSPRVEQDWVLAELLADCADKLAELNVAGLNIYVGVNPRSEKGKTTDASVQVCRTLFVDFDKLPVGDGLGHDEIASDRIEKAGLPAPTLRLFSGHGIHAYWRLKAPVSPAEWVVLQQRMIATLGTDPVIKNPERIMRLPGFDNLKEPKAPAFIIDAQPQRKHDLSELLVHLKDADDERESLCPPNRSDIPPTRTMQPWLQVKARAMLYAARWPAIAEHDGRNNDAYRHACQLTNDFDLADSDALEILRSWNALNHPPLPERELLGAFDSAKKHAKQPHGSKLDTVQTKRVSPPKPQGEPVDKAVASPKPSEAVIQVIEDTISGKRNAVPWPWPELGRLTEALLNGTVTMICGPKGATKTFYVLQCMAHWVEQGVKVALLVLEEDSRHCLMRCLAQASGMSPVTKTQWVKEHPEEARALHGEHKDLLDRIGTHIWDAPNDDMGLPEVSDWIEARAKDGYRIIMVDPITAATQTKEPWIQEPAFINKVKRTARQHGQSIILTTHPKKGGAHDIDMDSLASSAGYIRFSHNIFWLEAHDDREVLVMSACGRSTESVNRTLHILACRNGWGRGRNIAYKWHDESLTFSEVGMILKQEKKRSD